MKVEVGKSYVRRDGKIATVVRRVGSKFYTNQKFGAGPDYAYVHEDGRAFRHEGSYPEDFVREYFGKTEPYSHANLLRWIADGEQIQVLVESGEWVEAKVADVFASLADGICKPMTSFRIKPKTIKVNGVAVPAPLTVEPELNVMVYGVDPLSVDYVMPLSWNGSSYHDKLLGRGILHLSKDAAIQHAKALLIQE